MMTKTQIRKNLLEERSHILHEERADGIFSRNKRFHDYLDDHREIQHIFTFFSAKGEPDTHLLIIELLARNLSVSLPRLTKKNGKTIMEPVQITSLEQLTEEFFGIAQPSGTLPPTQKSTIDLVITPCLAIDNQGFRLGYGGGFYDMFFETLEGRVTKVAWQFESFCHREFPVEEFDIPVNHACTESKWHSFIKI